MDPSPLDLVDQAILFHLQRDGRCAITDIADAVDVSDNTVRNRIQKMEEEGVIEDYQVNVNYDNAGIQHLFMFVCTARVAERARLVANVRDLSGVVEVLSLMTGNENVYVVAAARDKSAITELAYDIEELGLRIEREHLISEHSRQAFSGFASDLTFRD
ncbi:Lrp/AsnC family transcriptional regulator [Halopelagius longus]|uniref:DNA-binding transcriptional regulator, Lrp family n=1 Tax=Halopelagius longus TaxID=1236180 RepID=A0A1H0XYN1_9EURY|nr:winged helix-turn-helix transcriptional regulator [Halopelagius longus]RDI72177.1 winged helix-turn-helix transcriptional regulator [Halopelagius longus]SDQ08009.1 DNA-binding transcriptional regulator, Lrp family [Halopelagius longus]